MFLSIYYRSSELHLLCFLSLCCLLISCFTIYSPLLYLNEGIYLYYLMFALLFLHMASLFVIFYFTSFMVINFYYLTLILLFPIKFIIFNSVFLVSSILKAANFPSLYKFISLMTYVHLQSDLTLSLLLFLYFILFVSR